MADRRGAAFRARRQAALVEISDRLHLRYGTAPLGNLPDPLDELIFIQISIRTRERAYLDVFRRLQELVEGDWGRLLTLPDDRVLGVLAAGGMGTLKLARLRGQVAALVERFGTPTLEPLRQLTDTEAEEFLTSLPGVGLKTARCVLLYSLERRVFPVDSNCLRVMRRLGLVHPDIDRKAAHDRAQDVVPPDLRHALHVNMVHLGRDVCRPGLPQCEVCVVRSLCPTGVDQAQVRAQ